MRLRRRHRPSHADVSCQQAVSLVTAYLDDALPYADRARFEAHMQDCEHCGEHLRQIQVTILVTGEIRAENLDPVAREDLMDLYRRWRDDATAN